ncbi:MAG: hypothetical protein FWE86_03490, partial [Oscillospiraceae bacterium]|nr:hypothetical protein [Oscillospiraceae bacterium]
MYDFDSVSCVVCERKFDGNGDTVVCPSCGAPHHRECYREAGKCRFDALHRENFVWEPKDERRAVGDLKDGRHQEGGADAGRASGSVCVSCGFANQENRLFCERCA